MRPLTGYRAGAMAVRPSRSAAIVAAVEKEIARLSAVRDLGRQFGGVDWEDQLGRQQEALSRFREAQLEALRVQAVLRVAIKPRRTLLGTLLKVFRRGG